MSKSLTPEQVTSLTSAIARSSEGAAMAPKQTLTLAEMSASKFRPLRVAAELLTPTIRIEGRQEVILAGFCAWVLPCDGEAQSASVGEDGDNVAGAGEPDLHQREEGDRFENRR
jgi:hypothetical protein